MKKLMMIFAAGAAIVMTGCSVTKVEYERNDKGEISYRIYRNGHWLKTEAEGMSGGMSGDGKFSIALDGMRSSPSEEFNRTMQTYTSAFVQLAQIAAAAYNPSASAAIKSAAQSANVTTVPAITSNANVATVPAITSNANVTTAAAECKDGSCTDTADCKDGSCTDKADCKDGSCETTSPARATEETTPSAVSVSQYSLKETTGTAGTSSGDK